MKSPFHLGLPRAFALICVAALLAGGSLRAAGSGENRAYAAATQAFQDGMWERAEAEFAQFVEKHPKSERVPEAVLLQAQAQFKLGKCGPVVSLLTARQGGAGRLADEYLFWMGEAQFASTNYLAAAGAFGQLARDFPMSARRLEATVGEAAARAKLGEWPRVVELLQKPDGVFQQLARVSTNHEFVAHGYLLLAEAGLVQKDYPQAEAALQPLAQRQLSTDLNWQRQALLCRIRLAAGRTEDARQVSVGLVSFADSTGRRDLLAASVGFQAGILEQLGRNEEAIAAYTRNLAPGTSVERQRQALLKVAALTVAQNRPVEAGEILERFLIQFSNAPAADVALLALGELHLKQHVALSPTNAAPPATNHLQLALANFDRLVSAFSNSTLVGRAELDRGWCFWISTNLPASAHAFGAAVSKLPPSEDLAVARFKLADAQFAQRDFAGALRNYQGALEAAADLPRVKDALTTPALYQIVRASLGITNLLAAEEAMRKILQAYPHSDVADRTVLLVAQGHADAGKPDAAQALFEEFVKLSPDSELRPEVELLIAQARFQKSDWPAAIGGYEAWLGRFPTNRLRPQAEFYRALANFQAGNETNALKLFTNFVAQFATNELAPQAQWWLADHYYSQNDFPNAEKNYKLVFQNWPASELAPEACMMSGRAAVGWQNYAGAIEYFTNLTGGRLDCPPKLKSQALFAYGGALTLLDPRDTNRSANLELAIQVFGAIHSSNPTNEQAALALGEIGKCYFQLAAQNPRYYESASNAYQQVIDSPYAGVAARSQAQVGLAMALEARAQPLAGDEQNALLKLALNRYLDVFYYEKNLREGEQPDLFWVKKAGLEAGRVAEAMQEWTQAMNLYRRLGELLPPLKEALERRIQKAQEHLATGKT
jgi:TolA-binding protein